MKGHYFCMLKFEKHEALMILKYKIDNTLLKQQITVAKFFCVHTF